MAVTCYLNSATRSHFQTFKLSQSNENLSMIPPQMCTSTNLWNMAGAGSTSQIPFPGSNLDPYSSHVPYHDAGLFQFRSNDAQNAAVPLVNPANNPTNHSAAACSCYVCTRRRLTGSDWLHNTCDIYYVRYTPRFQEWSAKCSARLPI